MFSFCRYFQCIRYWALKLEFWIHYHFVVSIVNKTIHHGNVSYSNWHNLHLNFPNQIPFQNFCKKWISCKTLVTIATERIFGYSEPEAQSEILWPIFIHHPSTFYFKKHLLRNRLTNFDNNLQGCSLGGCHGNRKDKI